MYTHVRSYTLKKAPSSTHSSTARAVIACVLHDTFSHPGKKKSFLGAERAAGTPEAGGQPGGRGGAEGEDGTSPVDGVRPQGLGGVETRCGQGSSPG